MSPPKWNELQERLLKEFLLARIIVRNTTPVIIGGYNAKPYSHVLDLMEEPRPTEIKGLWRWWARALVSGALLKNNNVITIDKADELISHILGGVIKGRNVPSKIAIKVKVLESSVRVLDNKEIERISRLKLLSQDIKNLPEREREKALKERFSVYDTLKLRIDLYSYEDIEGKVKSDYAFAVASLIFSLVFSGLGAITTRAFGSLNVERIELGYPIRDYMKDYCKCVLRIYHTNENIQECIWELIRKSLDYASEFLRNFKELSVERVSQVALPSIPSVITNRAHVFRLEVRLCRNRNATRLLEVIGNAVLKQNMKRDRRARGVDIHTFILGLPRSSNIPYGRSGTLKTGYVVLKSGRRPRCGRVVQGNAQYARNSLDKEKTDKLRRLSAIGFTVLRVSPQPLVLVYGMLANDIDDLKRDLVHRGVIGKAGRRGYVNKVIDTSLCNVDIIQEFDKLWKCIITILGRC